MRRASTLPDLSAYEADGGTDGPQANGAHDVDGNKSNGRPDRRPASEQETSVLPASGPGRPRAGETGTGPASGNGDSPLETGTPAAQRDGNAETAHVEPMDVSSPGGGEMNDAAEAGKAGEPDSLAGRGDSDGTGAAGSEEASDAEAHPAVVSPEEAERRAKEREKAAAGKPVLARVLQVMVAVFFPVVVLAAAIRAVATPLFLWAEYNRPGFPDDTYGFSADDRMTYGSYAVDYLTNLSGARYLGDLVGDGGQPLYLASEVSHMADVKTVLTAAFVTAGVMAVLGLLALLYLRRRSPGGIRRSLFAGAVVTLGLMAVLVVLAVLGWEQFFTQVHTLFFANGNWTFRLDDTLIRLFPAQFWMDAGIVIAALVLLTCAVVIACCWPTKTRRERVRQAREDARRRYAESLNAL